MSKFHGQFIWYELMTSDTQAAALFYQKVFGWNMKDSGLGDRSYSIISMGPLGIGGMMALPEAARAMGARPGWLGYVGVDDVDACVARIVAAGGVVHRAAEDIPGVGRFAVVADPQGAFFILMKGSSTGELVQAPPGTAGHVGWHELHAVDGASAFTFYADLFGWTKVRALDMGAMGIYQTFATGSDAEANLDADADADTNAIGGMMTKMPEALIPYWLYYVNVDGINAAMARVTEGGGKVAMGPHQVPTGQWIAVCTDPQGAFFAMLSTAL